MTSTPVPPILDLNRYTPYSPVASATDFSLQFPLFGDATDVSVYLNGTKLTLGTDYTVLSLSTGATLTPIPIADAFIRLTLAVSAGLVEIYGARRPRRTIQATAPYSTRDFNVVFSDVWATMRELWAQFKSQVQVPANEPSIILPAKALRAGNVLGFDSNGQPILSPIASGGTVGNANILPNAVAENQLAISLFNRLAAIYPTRATAIAATVNAAIGVIGLIGYTSAGDLGYISLYKRANAAPSHNGYFQSADGAYWVLADMDRVPPQAFGAVGNSTGPGLGTDDTAAINSWIGYLQATGAAGLFTAMHRYIPSSGTAAAITISNNNSLKIYCNDNNNAGINIETGYTFNIYATGACFFWRFEGKIHGNNAGPVLRIGKDDFSDAHNEFKLDIVVNNDSTNAAAQGYILNNVYNGWIWHVTNCNLSGNPAHSPTGAGTCVVLRQANFCSITGSCGNAAIGIYLTGGYTQACTITGVDDEEVYTNIKIDSANATRNTFTSGQFFGVVNVNATAGSRNVIESACNLIQYSGGSIGTNLVGIEIMGAAFPSVMGQPTFPATTVAYTNATGSRYFVKAWAGTITLIVLTAPDGGTTSWNPSVAGEQSDFVFLPNWKVTFTYTGSPAWRWFPM